MKNQFNRKSELQIEVPRGATARSLLAFMALSVVANIEAQPAPTRPRPGVAPSSVLRAPTTAQPQRAQNYFEPPPPNFFAPHNARLLVFINGIAPTPTPGHPGTVPSPPDDYGTAEDNNTLTFARNYWVFPFVSGLLGGGETLYDFHSNEVRLSNWSPVHMESPEGPPGAPPLARSIKICDELADPTHTSQFLSAKPDWHGQKLLGMLTYRPSHLSLMEQTSEAIKQIYDRYTETFGPGQQPQIILVCHSMGGLVARTICCNPPGQIASGEPGKARELESAIRQKADYIRSRTLCIVTLSSPHLGSAIPDYMLEADRRFNASGTLCSVPLVSMFFSGAHRAGMWDLRTSYWNQMNAGPLRLQNTKRPDGSAIPIHMFGGRSPAGGFFRSLEPEERGKIWKTDSRSRYDALGLVAIEDLMTHGLERSAWGKTEDPALDQLQNCSGQNLVDSFQRTFLQNLPPVMAESLKKVLDHFPKAEDLPGHFSHEFGDLGVPRLPVFLDHPYKLEWVEKEERLPNLPCRHPGSLHDHDAGIGGVNLPCTHHFQHPNGDPGQAPFVCRHPLPVQHPDGDPNPLPPTRIKVPSLHVDPSRDGKDGEIDSDGFVSIASSLAWGLGWGAEAGGGVYRHPEKGPWHLLNHGSIKGNPELARWLRDEIITKAGPVARPGKISGW